MGSGALSMVFTSKKTSAGLDYTWEALKGFFTSTPIILEIQIA